MENSELKSRIVSNMGSNYTLVLVRVVLGLVTFRLLYQGLSQESFGFWAFLWSVFGLGALLDFGFGLTVQKNVAQLSVKGEWEQLCRVLTTILYLYIGLALFIGICGIIVAPWVVDLVDISATNRNEFIMVTTIFFCGLGLSFPVGLFPEILRGLQEIRIANNLSMAGSIVNFILIICAMHFHWSLLAIVINSLVTILLPNLVAAFFGLRRLPEVSLKPVFFTVKLIRETLKFSISAYIIMVSYIVLAKIDHLVIASIMSAATLAIYQPGSRLGEIFGVATKQLANSLQPASAHLHAKNDQKAQRQLLVQGTRYSMMMATPLYLSCAFLMEPLLRILTGLQEVNPDMFWSAQALVLWSYSYIATHNTYGRIALMCDQESRLLRVSVGEALLNLGLSVLSLVIFQTIIGVAVATLLSSLFFGWGFLWRWAIQEAGLTGFQYTMKVIVHGLIGNLPLLACLLIVRFNPWVDFMSSLGMFFLAGILAGVTGVVGTWLIALEPSERNWVLNKTQSIRERIGLG